MEEDRIRAVLLALAEARKDKTFCPSEAAKRLDARDWRPLMPDVRAVAAAMQDKGLIRATRRGREVRATDPGGPIRLSRP